MLLNRIIFIAICLQSFATQHQAWAVVDGRRETTTPAADAADFVRQNVSISYLDPSGSKIDMRLPKIESRQNSKKQSEDLFLKMDSAYFINSEMPAFGKVDHSSALTRAGAQYLDQQGRFQSDIHWFYVEEEKNSYFDIPELSLNFKFAQFQMWVGRHLHTWSRADSFWQTGIWQPQFGWDGLNPKEQGLTGVFLNFDILKRTRLQFFGSGIYVPHRGAVLEERNGRIVSKNPWVAGTPAQVRYNGVLTKLNGHLDEPSVSELVDRPSVAVAIENRWGSGGRTQLAYAFKPVNQPQVLYEYYLSTPVVGEDYLDVTGRVAFPNEHIVSAEASWEESVWQADASVTYEDPILDQPREEWLSQDFPKSIMGTLQLHKNWSGIESSMHKSYLGVLKLWQEIPRDKGEFAQEDTLFTNRARYNFALKVGHVLRGRYGSRRNFDLNVSALYDLEQEAAIFQSRLDWLWSTALSVSARAEWLGATSNADGDFESSFIRKFKANDNIGLGVQYVY